MIRRTPTRALAVLCAVGALSWSPNAQATADWSAELTEDGRVIVSGGPAFTSHDHWVPGEVVDSTLVITNDRPGPVQLSLAAVVDAAPALAEHLELTAGDPAIALPDQPVVIITSLAGDSSIRVPVSAALSTAAGNDTQGLAAEVGLRVYARDLAPDSTPVATTAPGPGDHSTASAAPGAAETGPQTGSAAPIEPSGYPVTDERPGTLAATGSAVPPAAAIGLFGLLGALLLRTRRHRREGHHDEL